MATIPKVNSVSQLFLGMGAHFIGTAPDDYATADYATIVNSFKNLGDVLGDSTSYTGEDLATEDIVNEQGITVATIVTSAGSISYEFSILDNSPTMKKLLLGAVDITITDLSNFETPTSTKKTAQGFGHKASTFIAPFGFTNDTNDQINIIPKAKWLCSPSMDGKNSIIKVSVSAEQLDTENLKTMMSKAIDLSAS